MMFRYPIDIFFYKNIDNIDTEILNKFRKAEINNLSHQLNQNTNFETYDYFFNDLGEELKIEVELE